ncbi:MAG TPA: ADP/ATP-dependent (S)-NAD(P)H-hydrate dehydratase, partial [Aeromicrobium sp.]|nr:ADP/ATP-dependent (S)-NAD(P)H-hydrate dehydratase [Aeromicrobium sp.]
VDIGLAPFLRGPVLEAFEPADCGAELNKFAPRRDGHKYKRGVVGVAAGSPEFAGAAHLCVAGAQGGLSGMVRFVGPEDLGRRVVDRAPEVVATPGRVQAWTIGSGGGDHAREQLRMALEDGVPVVVDADGLRFLPHRFDVPALLTPHAGELAAMMGTTRAEVEANPLAHVEQAAKRWGATVLLKGRRTLIATVDRPTRVNLSGTPWLATAGAGDVLAGLAGSILAAGADPHTAGSLAAYVHGLAATRANPDGPVTAGQVAAHIPAVIADAVHHHRHEHALRDRD